MRLFAGILLGLSFASCVGAGAQMVELGSCAVGMVTLGVGLGMSSKAAKIPFTATVKSSFEQHLVDGNVITGEAVTHEAQNSQGWRRQEFSGGCRRDADGKIHMDLQVTVIKTDPRETLHWVEGDYALKQATLSHPVELTAEQRADQLARAKTQAALRPTPRPSHNQVKSESLGSTSIAGLAANGTRTTRTIPAGEQGNSLPLVLVNETWVTQDGLILKRVSDDPRRGKSTTEVTEFALGEPDPKLFAPPEGYTVKENPPPAMVAP